LDAGVEPERWTPGARLRVENWAFDCCLQALPGIVIEGRWGDMESTTAKELARTHMPKVFRLALKRGRTTGAARDWQHSKGRNYGTGPCPRRA
jgi:hypothetical protein